MRLATFTLLLVACHARPPAVAAVGCPTGTSFERESDSDVGWAEVEVTEGCMREGGAFEGEVTESLSTSPATKLVGRTSNGRRVGPWQQLDETGKRIGGFTLDADGSGTEIVRDLAGHVRTGNVLRGKREGTWTYADGVKVVSSETWSNGALVGPYHRVPWDPPMIDESDKCPEAGSPDVEDGCP